MATGWGECISNTITFWHTELQIVVSVRHCMKISWTFYWTTDIGWLMQALEWMVCGSPYRCNIDNWALQYDWVYTCANEFPTLSQWFQDLTEYNHRVYPQSISIERLDMFPPLHFIYITVLKCLNIFNALGLQTNQEVQKQQEKKNKCWSHISLNRDTTYVKA